MKRKLILTLIGMMAFTLSCNDNILDKSNPNEFTPDSFYRNGVQIVGAVNAVYSSLQSLDLFCREYFFLHDMRGDDVASGGGQLETHRAQLLTGTHDASNGVLMQVWRGWYRLIHQANQVIQGAPNASENVTEELKLRVVGEAKFLRALAYFDLVTVFGGVPLMDTYATAIGQDKPRVSDEEVYSLIIDDLEAAVTNLPLRAAYGATDRGRASKEAAQNLLARVHMQRGDYDLAEPLLAAIIDGGAFSDPATGWKTVPYLSNFREENEYNVESLFEVAFTEANGGSSWDASGQGTSTEVTFRGQEYGPNAWRNLIPSGTLMAEYEKVANGDAKDDPRYNDSFYFIGDSYFNGTKVLENWGWKKYQKIYKAENEDQRSGINMRVMRYTEVLLNMAEVQNALGNDNGADGAIALLNEVRSRVGVEMPEYPTANYPANSPNEVFRAIVHERRVELAGEQIRNRDILRWRSLGKIPAVIPEPISYMAEKHLLAPIPQQEINQNAILTEADQNPGW
ncbi:MAG TPA: RagB/SusD family nutrient uptake outer membrane protein [Ohtaekwangia sp.]